jgi:hypothetical protein
LHTRTPHTTARLLAALGLLLAAAAGYAQDAPVARPALTDPSGEPGLTYRYYEAAYDTVLNIDGKDLVREATLGTFGFPEGVREDNFALEFYGAIEVPTEGEYTFSTTSDDGSRLYIGDTCVVHNDYPHGETEKSGAIRLAAGRHPIYVAYFEGEVDQALQVAWEGPGIEKGPIPASVLTQYPKQVIFPKDAVTTTQLEWPELGLSMKVVVDTRDATDLAFLHRTVPDALRENLPKMWTVLGAEGAKLPESVSFSARPGIEPPAYASAGGVVLKAEYFAEHPGDFGCAIHEFAHILQHYRGRDVPGWLVEGIADYVRYVVGIKDGWSIPKGYRDGQTYTIGYWVTAAFLVFLEKEYDPEIVVKFDRALRAGKYSPDLWKEYTGKTLDELWEDYKVRTADAR